MREPGGNLERFFSAAHESDFGGDAVNIFLTPRVYIYTFLFFLSLSRWCFVSEREGTVVAYRYHDRLRARRTAVMKVFSAHVRIVIKDRRCLFQISSIYDIPSEKLQGVRDQLLYLASVLTIVTLSFLFYRVDFQYTCHRIALY